MDGSGMIRQGAQILVIDDEPTQRLLTREALIQRGYRVEEADSGEAGLETARRLKPDLILLDVLMPGMDGFDVCRAIRADETLYRTPVVIVTALENLDSIEIGFEAGATDFIAKPIVWPLLGYRLQFALRSAVMETDLVLARNEAEKASLAKSALLANMGHELRTPLNAIIGFSEFLRDQAVSQGWDNQTAEFLDDIRFSGQRLLATINDVLEMANLDAGRIELDESEIDLSKLLYGVVEKHRSAATDKGISLDARGAGQAFKVRGDYDVIRRAISKIVSNAIKFTPDGGIYISALRRPTGAVEIAITDTGVGMTDEDVLAIIEPFRQADISLSRRHEGSGLGVPLAKALLRLHGGELEIQSEPSVGTTMSIVLPAERVLDTRANADIN
jgi:signal transduction histidine kinase